MFTGDEALDNKTRRMVYKHIVEYPGVSYNKLKDIFELTDNSLRYHLNYLEKNGKIHSGLEKGLRCYYPHPQNIRAPALQESPVESHNLTQHQNRILNIIMRYPGINQKELVSRTRINRYKMMRSLQTLKHLNLIKNQKIQNMVCYEYIPDVEMKYKIMKGLMVKFLKDEIDEETFLKLKKRLDS